VSAGDRPEAVVFDLGGVLIAWDPLPAIAAQVGDEEAARFLAAEDFDFFAWNLEQDRGRPWTEAESAVAGSHPHWADHARAYRANFGLTMSELADNVQLLRDLHAAEVPLFALTNWSADLFPQALQRFHFLRLFDDIVVSGTERLVKPDPALFAVLEKRVGRPLGRCVFVDDSSLNVAAARSAGLDAIHYDGFVDLRAELLARGFPIPAGA
jgi:2-haloacid dehalogenase